MIIQLSPCIPVITPKGKALAHFLIDEGAEHDLKWVCLQDDTGECWTFANPMIRAQKNITQGREYISPFYNADDVTLHDPDECKFATHMLHLKCGICQILDWVPCGVAKDWKCPICSEK